MALINRKVNKTLLASLILAALAFSVYPSIASASNAYSGKNLPGGSWTAGNGVVLTGENVISGRAETTSSVCVGPITHDSGGFHAPYGWTCNPTGVTWNFAAITAAAGLYNPNPGTFTFFEVFANN
jgi:hypothetical protein